MVASPTLRCQGGSLIELLIGCALSVAIFAYNKKTHQPGFLAVGFWKLFVRD
jgi:hypothetical protein